MSTQTKSRLRVAAAVGLRCASVAIAFLVVVLLTRVLGPTGYGVYGLIIATVTILNVPLGVALATVLMREVSRARATAVWGPARGLSIRAHQAVTILAALVCACTAAVYISGLHLISVWLACAGAALCFDAISATRAATLRGLNAPLLAQAPDLLLKPGLIAILLFSALVFGFGDSSIGFALLCLAGGASAAALAGWLALAWRGQSPLISTNAQFADCTWAKSAATLASSSLVIVGGAYVEMFALATIAKPEDVGIYRVAAQVALAAGLGYTSLNYIVAPLLAYHAEKGEEAELARISGTYARLALALSIVAPAALLIAGPAPLIVLFGPAFATAYVPLMILLVGQMVNAAMGFGASFLLALKLERYILLGAAVGVFVSAAGTFVLGPYLGPSGAALAAAIGVATSNASYVGALYVKKRVNPTVFGGFRLLRPTPM